MSDEEYDYMSEDIITKCVEDVKPGLIHSKAKQRLIEISKKQEEQKLKNKPLKVIESERRNEGLNSALDSDNKGFALLQKMGYKPGQGIGKVNNGRIEPVEINLKSNREGLGRLSSKPSSASTSTKPLTAEEIMEFRKNLSKSAESKQDLTDFLRSQRMCHSLDFGKNKELPDEKWYWPKIVIKELENIEESSDESSEEEDEEEMELEASHKLELLTKYLRETHQYCLWCATIFDDEKDMKQSCPGPTRDDH